MYCGTQRISIVLKTESCEVTKSFLNYPSPWHIFIFILRVLLLKLMYYNIDKNFVDKILFLVKIYEIAIMLFCITFKKNKIYKM